MASTFSTISIAPSSLTADKKLSASAEKLNQLSPLASFSSYSFSGGRCNFRLKKQCSSQIRVMAKEFNKDESAIKKLQTMVNKLADLVGVTLGHNGRNVIL